MKLSLFLLGYLFPLVVTRGRQDKSNWCKNGGVRLENGTSQLEGRVEFCHRHQWVTVCDYQWGPAEAATVCRQLNITSSNGMSIPVYEDFFGTGSGEPLLKDVRCGEHETQLKHCNHTLIGNNETDYDFCSSFQAAGVICQGSSNCTDGEVRLRDGVTDWDGRVEICLNRVWGAVCNTNWDETDAETVCRQLHVTGERDSITLIIAFADDVDFADHEGKPPILLNEEVNCSVAHIRLIDCQSSSNDEECSDIFGVYAGAICQVEQVNVSSVNKTNITSYTTSQKLKPTLTTASVSGQLLTTPATLHESYASTITSETVIVRRTLSPSPGSTPSIDVSQVQTVTVDVEPSLSQFTTSKMTVEVPASATHDLVTSSITDETLTQPSTTDTFERSYTTLSEEVNPTTSRMVFQVIKTTAMINSNGGANGTSSPVYGPILGSIGALVFVLCAIVVLVTGIFVIVRHKKKYKIQEYSTVEGATALDNPVYDATEYLLVTTTTNNGVEGSDQTPVSSSQNGSANTLKHVVYESLKGAPNYHKEQMYEAPQVLVTSDTKGVNHTEVNTTEGNDDYSRLNMRDASYATLEPYIPGRIISSEVEPTNEEVGYSKLQHI